MHKKISVLVIILIIALCGTSLALEFSTLWNRPLGPGLDLPSPTGSTTSFSPVISTVSPVPVDQTPAVNLKINTPEAASIASSATPQALPAATSQPLCDGPATMTILAIGSDARSTNYLYGLADSIHIIRIDFSIPNIMIIDLPRDLWVEIPDIEDHYGITHGKLNQAYLFGNPGMGYYDGPGEGPGLLARTLELNFGLRVDHYIAINMQTFARVIDAVGGVDINLEHTIDLNDAESKYDPQLILYPGLHHLDGRVALLLATNRVPTTFTRMENEKIVMSALREKLLSKAMIPKLPKLAAQFITSVQTDLSLNDINSLICVAQAVPQENILADSFPQDMFTANATFDQYRNLTTFTYTADFATLREMVAEFMRGTWPFR
jgi:LCP family protein required for cell wall assembly